jgi:hypothetical protein
MEDSHIELIEPPFDEKELQCWTYLDWVNWETIRDKVLKILEDYERLTSRHGITITSRHLPDLYERIDNEVPEIKDFLRSKGWEDGFADYAVVVIKPYGEFQKHSDGITKESGNCRILVPLSGTEGCSTIFWEPDQPAKKIVALSTDGTPMPFWSYTHANCYEITRFELDKPVLMHIAPCHEVENHTTGMRMNLWISFNSKVNLLPEIPYVETPIAKTKI